MRGEGSFGLVPHRAATWAERDARASVVPATPLGVDPELGTVELGRAVVAIGGRCSSRSVAGPQDATSLRTTRTSVSSRSSMAAVSGPVLWTASRCTIQPRASVEAGTPWGLGEGLHRGELVRVQPHREHRRPGPPWASSRHQRLSRDRLVLDRLGVLGLSLQQPAELVVTVHVHRPLGPWSWRSPGRTSTPIQSSSDGDDFRPVDNRVGDGDGRERAGRLATLVGR